MVSDPVGPLSWCELKGYFMQATWRWMAAVALGLLVQACGGGADGASPPTATKPLASAVASTPTSVAPVPLRPLETPVDRLARSLNCFAGVEGAQRPPVLLVHGTALNAHNTFGWNYHPALDALAIPHCTVDLPLDGMGDVQLAAEHVVYAIREMARRSGHKVQVIGHSQGGMVPRWALRFWPDTRALVEDLVSLSGSHHGTLDARAICLAPCAPAIWQQRDDSAFLAALNRDFETLPGIDYTSIYTQLDEVVVPNLGSGASSRLSGDPAHVRNIATQAVCPLNTADHLLVGTSDPVAYALALDAILHPGPADPARLARSVCTRLFMPGVDPLNFGFDFLTLTVGIANQLVTAPKTSAEPPLKCYASGGC